MKYILFIISMLMASTFLRSQESFDASLNNVASYLAQRIDQHGNVTTGVWKLVNMEEQETQLSIYIAQELSIYLVNNARNFKVLDRYHLDQRLDEIERSSEGQIADSVYQELGKMLSIEYLITGTVDVITDHIKIRLSVIDTETSALIAGKEETIPVDKQIAAIIKNTPHGEQLNEKLNPETIIPKCEIDQTGSFCFTNHTDRIIQVTVFDAKENTMFLTTKTITLRLKPEEKKCIYDGPSKVYGYYIRVPNDIPDYNFADGKHSSSGQFKITPCNTSTFDIN